MKILLESESGRGRIKGGKEGEGRGREEREGGKEGEGGTEEEQEKRKRKKKGLCSRWDFWREEQRNGDLENPGRQAFFKVRSALILCAHPLESWLSFCVDQAGFKVTATLLPLPASRVLGLMTRAIIPGQIYRLKNEEVGGENQDGWSSLCAPGSRSCGKGGRPSPPQLRKNYEK